jgi:hypothetical protein
LKVFFYMGRNPDNKSGVSWKMWKIERNGRVVTTWWGPAHINGRRVTPSRALQSKTVEFSSAGDAKEHERLRVQNKLWVGYERQPRRRR